MHLSSQEKSAAATAAPLRPPEATCRSPEGARYEALNVPTPLPYFPDAHYRDTFCLWQPMTEDIPWFWVEHRLIDSTKSCKHRCGPRTRQGQPKKYISAQRDMMDLKGVFFVFETKMTLDRS